jgi:hypothetical protein
VETVIYRVYKKKRNLGISQEIDIVLKTKDFRGLGISNSTTVKMTAHASDKAKFMHLLMHHNSNMIY